MFHQRYMDNCWNAEGGFQLGLRSKAYDYFDAVDGKLDYTINVSDQYTKIDAGLIAVVGFKFRKQIKSLAVGVNYYYGLVNVSNTDQVIKNSSIYLYVKLPIGIKSDQD